jgi:hypothetical protein
MARIVEAAWEASAEWGLYIWLSVVLCARRGEVVALQWEDISLAPSHLIYGGEPEPGHVERVEHPRRRRQPGTQRRRITPVRVQRRGHTDPRQPGSRCPIQQLNASAERPSTTSSSRATAPGAGQVHDPGHERGRAGGGGERGLVHPDRANPGQPSQVVDQRSPVIADTMLKELLRFHH